MNRIIRVMVTGVAGGSIGEQVCKALRLGRWKYEITATNISMAEALVVKAENYETLPPVRDTNYLESIIALVRKRSIEFIIPGSEPELSLLSRCRETISNFGARLLINSDPVITLCLNKFEGFEFLAAHGFRLPATFIGGDRTALESISVGPPWIVKPTSGGGGSAFTFIAQDRSELSFFVQYVASQGYKPLIQEYVGDPKNEYTVGVMHSPEGDFFGAVSLRRQILSGLSNRFVFRNRTGRNELGPLLAISSGISQGKLVEFKPVLVAAKEIACCIGSTGPLNIQGRWDGKRFIPFEINPRFSGTTPIRAMGGINEPEMLIDWHLGLGRTSDYTNIRYGNFRRGLMEYYLPASEEESNGNTFTKTNK